MDMEHPGGGHKGVKIKLIPKFFSSTFRTVFDNFLNTRMGIGQIGFTMFACIWKLKQPKKV